MVHELTTLKFSHTFSLLSPISYLCDPLSSNPRGHLSSLPFLSQYPHLPSLPFPSQHPHSHQSPPPPHLQNQLSSHPCFDPLDTLSLYFNPPQIPPQPLPSTSSFSQPLLIKFTKSKINPNPIITTNFNPTRISKDKSQH